MRATKVSIIALLLAGALSASDAHAGEGPGADPDASPWTAVGLSAGVTTFGYGALAVAASSSGELTSRRIIALSGLSLGLFGPATGHLWTSDFDRAALFTAGRLLLAGTATLGITRMIAGGPDAAARDPHPYLDETLAIASLAGVAALTVWETVDAYRRAADQIEDARRARPSFTVAPLLAPPRSGAVTTSPTLAGVQAFARF